MPKNKRFFGSRSSQMSVSFRDHAGAEVAGIYRSRKLSHPQGFPRILSGPCPRLPCLIRGCQHAGADWVKCKTSIKSGSLRFPNIFVKRLRLR